MGKSIIRQVRGRRIWDSRGRPTVEATVTLADGSLGRGLAPAGASRGSREAVDLRDGGQKLGGFDVSAALAHLNGEIAQAMIGMDAMQQAVLDARLIALDGTPTKARLGGNATIAVSLAAMHAAAASNRQPLWEYAAQGRALRMPLPEIQIFGGGAHAGRRVDIQDFMVMPLGAQSFDQALEWCAEVYLAAGSLMKAAGKQAGVADEGGYWPLFDANEQALEMLTRAIGVAGLAHAQMAISLDIAASELRSGGRYRLGLENRVLDTTEMIDMLGQWIDAYPIVSIEDPLAEDDEAGLIECTRRFGQRVQIIGDDYLVTSAPRVRQAAALGACNCALIKPNQAGTVTETRAALDAAQAAGWSTVVSARSGETEDTSIVHLAVGWNAGQLKVGSFARSERMAKWNEGLRIEDATRAPFAGRCFGPSPTP
ncbi:phosphopyruvate hydratase [Verminephrobacter aporrectodeae subsp. tuberculatae]|uniref:phosphopyruvate hydratase n=1 Tax=Verminephrobacter aporrectodeae TaxID=1110389 RepID=UPI0004966C55|nr:phosphopyruvate hydratase [Verminephrobacter aporrectodeae]MCW5223043.1 phosphopyruvate hydratase [Verminephrobacter aporrectodeae subsp. tuberculatae]MCW5288507.1 phosphopyruvate hydratase [Verminephrobacter aporrectodeae subsp. tuberculatae]MCW8164557.1 phosphopyruvate hydratase [Verminephrobacter aporrectodeae subsp. tuberculatae]MCW8170557.1 phosphopyruvate hydratase [Verminephrobacter aporrectodeae subsp. tuberculatae]MCW8197428.1 phosphopyruvate hydratase [Verminephrobacter aporrectod